MAQVEEDQNGHCEDGGLTISPIHPTRMVLREERWSNHFEFLRTKEIKQSRLVFSMVKVQDWGWGPPG